MPNGVLLLNVDRSTEIVTNRRKPIIHVHTRSAKYHFDHGDSEWRSLEPGGSSGSMNPGPKPLEPPSGATKIKQQENSRSIFLL